MLYKVILTFESLDEILKCDHSNESYWAEHYFYSGFSGLWSDSTLNLKYYIIHKFAVYLHNRDDTNF